MRHLKITLTEADYAAIAKAAGQEPMAAYARRAVLAYGPLTDLDDWREVIKQAVERGLGPPEIATALKADVITFVPKISGTEKAGAVALAHDFRETEILEHCDGLPVVVVTFSYRIA